MKTIKMFVLVLLWGCNNIDNNIKEGVKSEIANTKSHMNNETVKEKMILRNKYEKAISKAHEPSKGKIQITFINIMESVNIIDSLRKQLSGLSTTEIKNVEIVRDLFITKGAGDTVFNRLERSYTLAQDLCLTEINRNAVKDINNKSLNFTKGKTNWKNQLFQLNNPLGAEMILFGLETELLKAASISFEGY